MTSEELFESKSYFSKWLNELTLIEKELIIDMLNEARSIGFDEGYNCAIDEFGISN